MFRRYTLIVVIFLSIVSVATFTLNGSLVAKIGSRIEVPYYSGDTIVYTVLGIFLGGMVAYLFELLKELLWRN